MALEPCSVDGVREALRAVGGKWKCEVVWHLRESPKRFNELRRALGHVTDRVLSRQLRELVEEGIIERHDHGTVPPHVEYALTEYGRELDPTLSALGAWGSQHLRRRTRS